MKINLQGAKNIHFIGIGGISMSGIAEILHRHGFTVTGSDDTPNENTARLQSLGINVKIPNAAENITQGIDIAVYTAAVKPDNPEYAAAQSAGIKLIERAPFLGLLANDYQYPVCVAGTHGKTTTTSMVAETLIHAGYDPTVSIGGHMNATKMNYRIGESGYFVLEACEYSNSFHHWQPHAGIILNIDADHLDYFGDMENLIAAFVKFASNIREDGVLVIRTGIQGFNEVTKAAKCKVVTFGENADFTTENISYHEGKPHFDIIHKNQKTATIALQLPGEYNMLNALACYAAATHLNIPPETAAAALQNATGTKRRFEYKGTVGGAKVIDDYAHHPTEIRACLAAARKYAGDGKIITIFQPHTYTRTKNLLHEFAECFTDTDILVLLPIYAAREPFDSQISSEMLADLIKQSGKSVKTMQNFPETQNFVQNALTQGDLIITMGAGDVYEIADALVAS